MTPGPPRGQEAQVFTGIVEERGRVAAFDRLADSAMLTIEAPVVAATAGCGDSIAVSGVCLTVTKAGDGAFSADVIGETLARTCLGKLEVGDLVNLERPVPVTGRLDGHIVQGHVDGTGVITARRRADGWDVLRISADSGLLRYMAYKGSVAVHGVSLTISAVSEPAAAGAADGWFEVSLIPETLARTTFGLSQAGDLVNIEVDLIAKYIARLLAAGLVGEAEGSGPSGSGPSGSGVSGSGVSGSGVSPGDRALDSAVAPRTSTEVAR
jgi:riboflavin synthase